MNCVDTTCGALMTGTGFIAYPVAVEILKNKCQKFRKILEDPKASKIPIYVTAGALGAAICTATNYPLSVCQANNGVPADKKKKVNLKGALSFYVDQIGSSIGFAATMGTLAPKIPVPNNSLLAAARNHALVNISNIGGKVLSYPIHRIRHGSTLCGMVGGYLKNMGGVVITGDATDHFKRVLGFMIQ